MRSVLFGGLGLLTALGACAPTAERADGEVPPRARQCFSIQQVDNFRQGRPDQVFIRVRRNDVYELTAAGCMDLDFANRLALLPDGAGLAGSRLCTDDWARIVVPGSTSPNSVCRVRISRKLTEAEIADLPAAHRP
ncbi:DUF6491 family protein [Brevundimonas viscosa]|uniref:Lipoprotein n=1 Tax=Brevundimonas viscosa TaxID=871741 RepID=A0A1I6NUK1_9CAUL|nr:DUF6491 family protein [Brevundimonas viscosa]SFS31550.1 hypothetical protein SAMN05192570_0523 [Brevundimonas viscosa]